jgi:hypothetical protein
LAVLEYLDDDRAMIVTVRFILYRFISRLVVVVVVTARASSSSSSKRHGRRDVCVFVRVRARVGARADAPVA